MTCLELWVEGPTDARICRPEGEALGRDGPLEGALPPLVRKALGEDAPSEDRITAYRLTGRLRKVTRLDNRKLRQRLSTKGWKVLAAIDQARGNDSQTAIVAIWDRDGEDEPLRDRDLIHETLRERGAMGACVGICIEEIEAWLLADPGAFKRCFGHGLRGGLPGKPEDDPDPKATLDDLLPQDVEDGRAVLYRKLAEAADIAVLERKCPRGFGDLVRALDEFIRPRLRGVSQASP